MYVLCRADGDCLMLAQAMDLPTSVRLARTKAVDMRLFRHTPKLPPTDVRIFLSMLAFEQHYSSTSNVVPVCFTGPHHGGEGW